MVLRHGFPATSLGECFACTSSHYTSSHISFTPDMGLFLPSLLPFFMHSFIHLFIHSGALLCMISQLLCLVISSILRSTLFCFLLFLLHSLLFYTVLRFFFTISFLLHYHVLLLHSSILSSKLFSPLFSLQHFSTLLHSLLQSTPSSTLCYAVHFLPPPHFLSPSQEFTHFLVVISLESTFSEYQVTHSPFFQTYLFLSAVFPHPHPTPNPPHTSSF